MFKEILGDALGIIEKVAPTIAQAVSMPYLGTASIAAKILCEAFGLNAADVGKLGEQILENPNNESILQTLEHSFSKLMKAEYIKFLPSSAELNIKLQWNSNNTQNS